MRKSAVICLLLALPSLPALAAAKPDWLPLQRDGDERVALDVGRIGRFSDGHVAAWSRLSLGFDMPDAQSGVRYSTIEAFNSYDCKRREYSTLKRVYLDGKGKVVREETVAQPRNMLIGEDSFEEKLLPEVCQRRAQAPLIDKPKPVVQAQAAAAPKVMPVSDTKQSDAPSSIPPGKPHLIDLPKIDPSKVENPRPAETPKPKADKAQTEKAKVEATPTSKTAADKAPPVKKEAGSKMPAESSKLDAAKLNALIEQSNKAAQAARKTKKDKPAGAPDYYTGDISRAEIERQLATFGPRRNRGQGAKGGAKPDASAGKLADVHWSYAGKGGPDNWAKLSSDNHLCADGKRQSPIDIRDGIPVDLEPIQFNYGKTSYSEIDNGHTIQVNVAEGQSIRIMGKTWQLIGLHFHKPGEERMNGRSFAMVAHLVHKDAEGHLAVVAVLLEPGAENPQIQSIWNNLPLEQGMVISPSAPIDLAQLLPEKRDYATYMGSLTTPPCSEDVLWMVMKQPVQISPEQIRIFGRLYPDNARPVQASNNRLIKESR